MKAALRQDWTEVRDRIAHNGRGGSRVGADPGIEYPEGALIPDGTPSVSRADPVNDDVPQARPGARAPPVDLGHGRSVLGLFASGFTLVATGALPDALPPVRSHAFPPTPPLAAACGLRDGGCVLVRPDGYVAARWPDPPAAGVVSAAQTSIRGRGTD